MQLNSRAANLYFTFKAYSSIFASSVSLSFFASSILSTLA